MCPKRSHPARQLPFLRVCRELRLFYAVHAREPVRSETSNALRRAAQAVFQPADLCFDRSDLPFQLPLLLCDVRPVILALHFLDLSAQAGNLLLRVLIPRLGLLEDIPLLPDPVAYAGGLLLGLLPKCTQNNIALQAVPLPIRLVLLCQSFNLPKGDHLLMRARGISLQVLVLADVALHLLDLDIVPDITD